VPIVLTSMASPHGTQPFPDLVEESLDEATFLWRRWEADLTSLTRNLDEVWSWTEDRLHGALDGIRVASTRIVDVAMEGLRSSDTGRVTVCAGVLGSSTEPSAIDVIATAIGAAEGERLRAMVRGLELIGSNPALRAAAAVLATTGPAHAGALCRLKAFHRVTPDHELRVALNSDVTEARLDGVRAAQHLPLEQAEKVIASALRSPDAMVLAAAVEAGLSSGIQDAWPAVTRVARQLDAQAGPLLKPLALLGTAKEHESIYAALRVPELQTAAIWALGHIGTVRAAEACLAGAEHENLARACGEAYCWITGADLARDRLTTPDPPAEVPALEDDDLDANLVPAPEALWPLPDPSALRQHWLARRASFAADVRYIHGRPATIDTVADMIENGPMLRRPDLVLELRARTRGGYDVETRAFASRQRQMMTLGRSVLSTLDGR
jgi:uncharacterized protein (TIGR02270 family)